MQGEKIQWNDKKKKSFEAAIKELIRQTNKCLEKYIEENGDIAPGSKARMKGLTSKKEIEKYLDFLKCEYEIEIGSFNPSRTGYLPDNTWIYFAPKNTLNKESDKGFINSDKLDGNKGIWIYFSYCGYYEKKPYLQLGFGADDSLNNPLCKAARKIQEVKKKYYKCEEVDKSQFKEIQFDKIQFKESQFNNIVNGFIAMYKYLNPFEPDDFRIENSVQNLSGQDSNNSTESTHKNIPLNQILFGPPGTGKTYDTINKSLEILQSYKQIEAIPESREAQKELFDEFKQKGQIAFVTFHQSYGYEEFVEGIKPDVESSEVRYQIKSGIFKTLCKSALENPQIPYILIIDEINRGNIAKILGELITLLESSKRIGEPEELRVSLPYSGDEFDSGKGFGVPKNLYIIGTMNTADRSIALLDTALRRRFEFIEMMPDYNLLEKKDKNKDCDGVKLKELLEFMNKRITFLLDREHQIGHSFLLDVKNINDLRAIFAKKIIPLLQEYFYDDYAKIVVVLNDNKMVEWEVNELEIAGLENNFKQLVGFDFTEKKIKYRIVDEDDWKEWQFQKIYDDNAKPKNTDSTESSPAESADEPSAE